jgi:amidohydrolase
VPGGRRRRLIPDPIEIDRTLAALPGVVPAAVELYIRVHQDPELSGDEERTAARFAETLAASGLEVTRGVGGHGVVGILRNGPGPAVMLRAELDALPVREETGLPYASAATGQAAGADGDGRPGVAVMHACGHDLHLACAAGASALLAAQPDRWHGTLVVIGQPAEETLQGAEAMLGDGLYDLTGPPDVVLAQHTAPLPAGMLAHPVGPATAASVSIRVVLHGRGGHASSPHLAVDPVVIASALVLRLQTIVSRETAPGDPVAVTVGSLHAGSTPNTVPEQAVLELTVRALAPATLERALAAVRRITAAECAAAGSPREPEISILSRSPAGLSDQATAETVQAGHRALFGPQRVTAWPPSLATEDFPLFGPAGLPLHGHDGIRTAYWMLGVVGRRQWDEAAGTSAAQKLAALPSNHSPRFRPDPRTAVPAGISALASAALLVGLHPGGRADAPAAS